MLKHITISLGFRKKGVGDMRRWHIVSIWMIISLLLCAIVVYIVCRFCM